MPEGYSPWKTSRHLIRNPVFDPSLPTPCTILTLSGDAGAVQLEVEFWHQYALMTEGLVVNDSIQFSYESFWPTLNYDRTQEPGQYQERWICTAIFEMSRPPPSPLRVPPPQPAIWGEFEKLIYSQHLASVR
jgi:hypothetical protein